jgi:hypothetical protein
MAEHAPAPSYPANTAPTPGMTAEQQYIFDLAGFCVIANVLSPEELRALNAAVDRGLSHYRFALPLIHSIPYSLR